MQDIYKKSIAGIATRVLFVDQEMGGRLLAMQVIADERLEQPFAIETLHSVIDDRPRPVHAMRGEGSVGFLGNPLDHNGLIDWIAAEAITSLRSLIDTIMIHDTPSGEVEAEVTAGLRRCLKEMLNYWGANGSGSRKWSEQRFDEQEEISLGTWQVHLIRVAKKYLSENAALPVADNANSAVHEGGQGVIPG